jgi:hypothetical protein
MIKLKKLIKEHAWDRKFGEPLPTLEDVAKKHQIEEKEFITEANYPSQFSNAADIMSDFKMRTLKPSMRTYSKELGKELKFAEKAVNEVVNVLDDIASKMEDM